MYMYEENFKKANQDVTQADTPIANAVLTSPSVASATPGQEVAVASVAEGSAKKPLTIKKACIIAAVILLVSAIAVFFILGGGGLFAAK